MSDTKEELSPLAVRRLRRSNSTSSLYVVSTISSPILQELVLAVSTMLHCQMVRDDDSVGTRSKRFPHFREERYISTGLHAGMPVPSAQDIYKFLIRVFETGEFPPECVVILLVYINRLIGLVNLPLSAHNWKPVTITSLVLAQKVWDDHPLCNADFAILYPTLKPKDVNFLELQMLILLEYKLTVTASLYARYYFELRTIYENEWRQFPTKLLTIADAQLIEERNKKPDPRQPPKKLTTKDFEDLAPVKSNTLFVIKFG